MARLEFSGLDSIMLELSRKGEKASGIIDEMLKAGADTVVDAWKQAITEAGLIKTGAMLNAVAAGEIHKGMTGGYVEVYPRGVDGHGVRNADKAFILHYGTSRIRATGFVDRADKLGEEAATLVMKSIWDQQ